MTDRTSARGGSGRTRWALAGVGAVCCTATVLLGMVAAGAVPAVDAWVLANLSTDIGSGPAAVFTVLGELFVLVAVGTLIAAGVLAWRTRSQDLATVARLVVVFLAACCGALLQSVFQRVGPPAQPEWTYPSGHATTVTAVALTAVLIATSLPARWRNAIIVIEVGTVVFACLGRVLAGEHYLTDIVGGIGAAVGIGLLVAGLLGWHPAPARVQESHFPAR